MRKPTRSRRDAGPRPGEEGDEGDRELALLREFALCGSVAALAAAMASRLGGPRSEALIEQAGLAAPRKGV
jgi:hypothetical protein